MAQLTKVANPASSLLLVNGRKRKGVRTNMATRIRKATNRRRTNPRRRNAQVVVRTSPRRSNFTRGRWKANPVRRRRRARNPQLKTLIVGAMYATAGAMANGVVAGFIPIQASGLAGIGVQLGTAYLTAMVGERILGAGLNSQFFAVGAAASVGKAIIDYVFGLVGSTATGLMSGGGFSLNAAPAPAPAAPPPGVSDVMVAPPYYIGASGMSDIQAAPSYYQ